MTKTGGMAGLDHILPLPGIILLIYPTARNPLIIFLGISYQWHRLFASPNLPKETWEIGFEQNMIVQCPLKLQNQPSSLIL
jgi:hypothetical protein